MIKGMHGLFYTPEAEALREFLRDKLELDHIDTGGGWLIFGVPKAELGVHPGEKPKHEISFWCDNIEATVATLEQKGVTFKGPITDTAWGRLTTVLLPGGGEVGIYQPLHAQP